MRDFERQHVVLKAEQGQPRRVKEAHDTTWHMPCGQCGHVDSVEGQTLEIHNILLTFPPKFPLDVLLPLGPASPQGNFLHGQLTTLPWHVLSMIFSASTAKECLCH